jgi:hypothetical protein
VNPFEHVEADLPFGSKEIGCLTGDEPVSPPNRRRALPAGRRAADRTLGPARKTPVQQSECRQNRNRFAEFEVIRPTPRLSGALSIQGRSSRMSDDACTSSTAAAAWTARVAVPPHNSAASIVSTARTRFDGAWSVCHRVFHQLWAGRHEPGQLCVDLALICREEARSRSSRSGLVLPNTSMNW